MNYLGELNKIKPVWIELGLQTIHEKTHAFLKTVQMNTFLQVLSELNNRHITVITHVILGLPFETYHDNIETIDFVAYILFRSKDSYALYPSIPRISKFLQTNILFRFTLRKSMLPVCDCLEHLREDQVIHRLTGDCNTGFNCSRMDSSQRQTLNPIHQILTIRDSFQGKNLERHPQ